MTGSVQPFFDQVIWEIRKTYTSKTFQQAYEPLGSRLMPTLYVIIHLFA